MERLTFTWAVNLLFKASCVQGDFVEPLEPVTFLHSLIGSQTRLPCHYKEEEGEQVLQVIWQEEHTDGNNEQVIRAHFTDGITVFVRYIGRVKFESSNPTANSALLIPITEVSDEGTYICSIELYPRGTFVRRVTLKVWNPVSPVHLKVDLVFNTSTFCNLTVTCSTDHSFFGSSFTCGSKSCKQDDGQQTEVKDQNNLLQIYLSDQSVICNYSNYMNWANSTEKIGLFCPLKDSSPVSVITSGFQLLFFLLLSFMI